MNAPLPLSAVCLLLTPPVTSSCQGSAFFPVRAPNLTLSPSYLGPPLLLLAGRLGGEHFGGEWAKGGQTRSLCVHVEEQETGRVAAA